MIEIKDLKKYFITEDLKTFALNGVDFVVNEGDFLGIMGPSGCGKSTLLNILGMLDGPSEGTYIFNGTNIAGLTEAQRTQVRKGNIGFIFQNFNLIDTLTIYENVELPLKFLKVAKSERKVKVEEVLNRMNIFHRANHFPKQLSGGQQQRAAIARAVVTNPKIILADEPTGNLDSKNGIEVMELLTELSKSGATIIMVTHSDRDSNYAHKVIHLFDGKIAAEKINQGMEMKVED